MLVNNNEYGGSGSVNSDVAYHRFPQYGPQVAIHEFSPVSPCSAMSTVWSQQWRQSPACKL
ncbi:MAG: hypothetical protein IPO15_18465 [Anaerolineae bacterium]|nr:hypothetical protein [Anaerolineae bacterium]